MIAGIWVLVLVWQTEEHVRVRDAAKTDLRNRSKDIANTLSAIIRGMRFRGAIPRDRLETVLNELVNGRTNELVKSSELLSIVLLNSANENVASAGVQPDLQREDLVQEGEHWGKHAVILVNPVDLGSGLSSEGITNTFILPPPPSDFTNRPGEAGRPPFQRREPPPEPGLDHSNSVSAELETNMPAPPPREDRPREAGRPRRPFWLRGMDEKEFQSLVQKQTLHGLVLVMSTEGLEAASTRDLWLRAMILFLASISAAGSSLAWRNLAKTSELQIRLVRASELNTHLREMKLAAAGLAHETRNPLNIIRGLAQLISKQQPEGDGEVRQKARDIVNEADKVAAQLNEFINYSRPREVRRSVLSLGSVVNEVVRALGYDLEEKKIRLQVKGDELNVEADEQLLRQALFNLILNAIQAVDGDGEIQVLAERRNVSEATLEVRDNGPGVPPERRDEIFKPYFTTQKTGTGLGLAVVQQIVLAHGWEIECLANEPKGARFRISHLKLAG